jgi:hypothetical protein
LWAVDAANSITCVEDGSVEGESIDVSVNGTAYTYLQVDCASVATLPLSGPGASTYLALFGANSGCATC